jgi:hypothetical protein
MPPFIGCVISGRSHYVERTVTAIAGYFDQLFAIPLRKLRNLRLRRLRLKNIGVEESYYQKYFTNHELYSRGPDHRRNYFT